MVVNLVERQWEFLTLNVLGDGTDHEALSKKVECSAARKLR